MDVGIEAERQAVPAASVYRPTFRVEPATFRVSLVPHGTTRHGWA